MVYGNVIALQAGEIAVRRNGGIENDVALS